MQRLAPRLVTKPGTTPVDLAAAKRHLRVEHDEDDGLIEALIEAATSQLDALGYLGRCIMPQVWSQPFPGWGCGVLRLPFPDASAVSVEYLDAAGAEQTLDPSAYEVVETLAATEVRRRVSIIWPWHAISETPVSVTATFGYADAAAVPGAIKAAILLMVGDLYRFRETAVVGAASGGGSSNAIAMSASVDNLLASFRHGLISA